MTTVPSLHVQTQSLPIIVVVVVEDMAVVVVVVVVDVPSHGWFVVQSMQGAVAQSPGPPPPTAPQKPTHSACLSAQKGVGPVQSVVAGLAHGVCPSPQVHAIVAPAAPQAGNVVVVVAAVVVVVVGQGPQSSVPPQPSGIIPQSWAPQVAGVQQALWKQTCPLAQAETQVWLAPQVRQALVSQVSSCAPASSGAGSARCRTAH